MTSTKLFKAAGIVVLLTLTSNSNGEGIERHPPYVSCNVYLRDVCFGIAQGDALKMEIPVDYVLYHVSFSSGGSAKIYVGYNPDRRGHSNAVFEKCERMNGFAECRVRRSPDGKVELIARASEDSLFVHATIDGLSIARTQSFIQNIRACSKKERSITCAD